MKGSKSDENICQNKNRSERREAGRRYKTAGQESSAWVNIPVASALLFADRIWTSFFFLKICTLPFKQDFSPYSALRTAFLLDKKASAYYR